METQEAGKKREAEESPAKPKKKSKAESSSAKRAPEGSPQKEKKKSKKASSSTYVPISIENPEERPPPEAKRSDGSAEPKGKPMKPVIKHPSAKKAHGIEVAKGNKSFWEKKGKQFHYDQAELRGFRWQASTGKDMSKSKMMKELPKDTFLQFILQHDKLVKKYMCKKSSSLNIYIWTK